MLGFGLHVRPLLVWWGCNIPIGPKSERLSTVFGATKGRTVHVGGNLGVTQVHVSSEQGRCSNSSCLFLKTQDR